MSVWPSLPSAHAALRGSEGELVSISVTVEPRDLEDILEALAVPDFPINPQIYHDAAVIYVDRDGGQRAESSTLVEFPAYAAQLPKIRAVLESCGFAGDVVWVSPMLDEMHAGEHVQMAPPGASYAYRILRKQAAAAGAGRN
jgi:hypothetical protein